MSIRVARKRADSYQHGDLRRALVQAGLKLLADGGVDGLSLRGAAELAGVSHAAPYRHFRDKDALVAAVAEEGFRLLTRHMRDEIAARGGSDVLGRLRAAALGYVSFAVAHPATFRTIFGGAVCAEGEQAPASLRAAGEEAYRVLRELIAEGIEREKLRAGDPDQLALAAWSMVHGLGMLIIEGQLPEARANPAQARAATEGVVRLLETGLRR
ncbi:MAG TPA: TetR/AcrR family transcriptional regulator [Polyangia bacterium]|jgi:AcrR family transcriptional regulator